MTMAVTPDIQSGETPTGASGPYSPVYETEEESIFQRYKLASGNEVRFAATEIRKERTGVHANVVISLNQLLLAWTEFNVSRDEDRVRLANSAHAHLGDIDNKTWPKTFMKHALDIFCAGLWTEQVRNLEPELMAGDPDVGPPLQLISGLVVEGGGSILYAPPGRGKSYTAMAMAVSLDACVDLSWTCGAPRKVMYINLERSRESMQHRLSRINRAFGLPERRPIYFLNVRGKSLQDVADSVRRTMRLRGLDMVFLDSISRAGFGDLNDNQPANRIIDTLNRISPTWMALGHTPRNDDSHIFGSMHFEAGEDIGIQLATQTVGDTTGVGLMVTKANDIAKPPLMIHAFDWGENGLEAVRCGKPREFAELEATRKVSLKEEVRQFLQMVGTATAGELADELERDRSTVSRLLYNDPDFQVVRKEGRNVLYGVKGMHG